MSFRQELFRKIFVPAEFAAFRASYESINPDRPLETAGVSFNETDPLLRSFVNETPELISFADEFLPQLGTFLHGPFPLPGGRVTRSAWDCRGKAGAYKTCGINAESVKGKRVLDIGCNAGYDTFYLNALGALETVGLEPRMFYFHAMFLNAVYNREGVSFHNAGWENLDANYLGNFDLVNCLGLIYHVKEPMLLLETIASFMRPGAKLIMETHILSESSRQACFIEGAFWGDATYWWIFGDECLMDMLRSSGFKDVSMRLKADCDSRNPGNPRLTVEGYPAGARAWFVATRNEPLQRDVALRNAVISDQKGRVGKLEEGKQGLAGRNEQLQEALDRCDAALAEQKARTGRLEEGKQWLAGENEQLQKKLKKCDAALAEQKTWTGKLEEGKQWLAGQNERLQKALEKCDAALAEQKSWTGKLEESKQWLAGQNEQLRREMHEIKRSRLWRILNALRSIFGSRR